MVSCTFAGGREQAAQLQGIINPTPEDCIACGVNHEAAVHPANISGLTADDLRRSLRHALFDLGPSEVAVDPITKDRVYGRLVDAMQPHLGEPIADFNRWFFENVDGIVHQISKRKKPDGPIQRAVVRQAILEIVFDSWRYVGQNVSIFMRSVSRAIKPSLSTDEQTAFDVLYRRNQYLGDLPLVLFHEQFPKIRPAVLEIYDNPHAPAAWGRLQRVLHTYAMMIARRRDADRLRKRSRKDKCNQLPLPAIGPEAARLKQQSHGHSYFPVAVFEPEAKGRDPAGFDEIASEVLERRGVKCECAAESQWDIRLVEEGEPSEEIVLFVKCHRCDKEGTHRVPRCQFEQVAKQARCHGD